MANSIGSRYIEPGSSPQRMAQAEKAIQQLQRAMTNLPKAPVVAEFEPGTTVITGAYNQNTVGSTTTAYGQDWVIETAAESVTANAPTITVSETNPERLVAAESGLYMVEWRQSLSFAADAPSIVGFTFNYVTSEYLVRWTEAIHAADGYLHAEPGTRVTHVVGPMNWVAGEEFYPRMTWASVGHTAVDVGIFLRVTRLG